MSDERSHGRARDRVPLPSLHMHNGRHPVAPPVDCTFDGFSYENHLNGQGQNRTADTRIFSPLLYRLSYLAEFANYLPHKNLQPLPSNPARLPATSASRIHPATHSAGVAKSTYWGGRFVPGGVLARPATAGLTADVPPTLSISRMNTSSPRLGKVFE